MEALKFLFLLFLWYEHASAQTTGISCSVTVIDDTANITVDSNINGTFRCIVDEQDLEICNSGDTFEDLSEGVHSITIQFTQNGSTPIDCLIQNFTISRSSISFGFDVEYLYIGNVITFVITPSSDGIFCCQLDQGTCIRCESGFQLTNVPSGPHTITVQGASVTSSQLSESVTLQVPEFTVAADVIGSTITLLISPDADAVFRCRLDDNDPVACSNGSQFRGVSAGQHIIEVEKIDSVERATATVAVTVSERVVSFMNLQVDVNQMIQNYTFTFTLTGEPSGLEFNLLIDSNIPVMSSCSRIMGTNYSCSFLRNSDEVSLGHHDITIQALLNNTVYGEITERFFVFQSSTVRFKDSSYMVKEDDETYTVTIQKFGVTTQSITVSIQTRTTNPRSAIPSTDYPTFAGIVTFEAGSTSERSVEVRVVPDDVFEANETFVLALFVPSSVRSSQNLEVTNDRPVVTIVNDDNVTVNLQSQVSAVVEGGSYVVNVTVEPTTLMASFDVIVQTYFCGGCIGADPGIDYLPVNQTVTLGPGNTDEQITIDILEDIFTESNDEVVCVRIILPETSQAAGVLLNSSETNFTIIDTDDNSLNLSFNTTTMRNQTDMRYTISVDYSAAQQATMFNCRLNDQTFLPCDLPQVYTDLRYDSYAVTVQALSDSSNVTIVQKVLMVRAEVGIINGTSVLLHIQSTLPATYRCRLNGEESFPCNDQQIISGLSRENYILTVEAISTDNNALTAFEDFPPVFLFGSNITEGQSSAVTCSGGVSNLLGVNYTASWRAREDRIDFVLTANTSQKWLAIGFTDKQMTKYDLIVGATDNDGTYFVDDRNFIGREPVVRDSEQNIENANVLFDDGITIMRFSRIRDTGDEDDFSLDVCRYFLFAFGEVIDIRSGMIDIGQRSASDVSIKQRFDVEEPICIPTSSSLCPEVFDCGDPGEPVNGTVQVVGNNLEGSIANYDCNEGHLLIGENQRTCTSSDSIWTGAVPECLFVDCGHPGTPSNGSSDFNSTLLNAAVRHSCDSGYVLCYGNESRTCQPNMSWSGTIPQCIRVTVTVNDTVSYEVGETDGVVNITLIFDQPSCQPVTIVANPRVRSILDATVGDFNDTAVMITVAPEDTTATVPISIINDDLLESAEVFEVAIEIGGTGAVVGQPGVAEVTIVSEDVVMVMFTESEYNESEGAGSMRIGVQLSRILQQMIIIQVVTTPITAEGNGVDFDSTIRNVTFMAGTDSSFVFIPIIDNNVVENIENFSLSIQIPPAFADIGVMLGAASMATGFIVDDDVDCGRLDDPENGLVNFVETYGGSVANYSCNETFVLCGTESRVCQLNGSWSGSPPECLRVSVSLDDSVNYTVEEDGGSIDIIVLLNQPSCRPVTIIVTPSSLSATALEDFNDTALMVTIAPGDTTASVPISIINDDLLESTEVFDVAIEIGGTDTDGAVVGQPGVAQVIIVSEDVVMVMFAESEYNESEGAGSMRIGVQLSRILQQMIIIQVVTTPITAEGNGVDFDSTIRNVTFMAGSDSSFVFIPIIDNNVVENIENFSLSIQIPPALADIGVMLGAASMATGFIVDDDVDCGNLEDPDNGQVNFMETFGGSIANYSCEQGFVLCGTESRTCLSNGSWSGSSPNCTRVIISVDDSNSYLIFENQGSIDIILLLDQPSCRPITIIADPQERSPPSATVNDFNDTSVIVIVDPGETRATASISIIDDDLLEPTEFFDVEFSIGGANAAGAVIRDPGIAGVSISNDDIVVAMFAESEFNASEGAGVISIEVELSMEPPQNISLQLNIIPVTAEGGDINSESINITFERGIRILEVNISINDDDIFEPVESVRFMLQVLPEFSEIGVRLGFVSEAVGNIIDDEADCGEPGSPVNGMVSFNSTVEGSIANYTCDEGYLLSGVTQRSCNEGDQWSDNVPLCLTVHCGAPPIPTNGMVMVPSETFGSAITHTCSAGFLLCGDINRTCLSNGSWSGSTPDCISVIVTVMGSAFANENSGAANIMVSIDQPSCLPITIIARPQVRSIPSATESDFNTSVVIEIIDPGDTSTTISIPIFNDNLLESTELFNVFIEVGANDTNYVTVTPPGLSQVSIFNDDLISAGFTATEYTVTEGEGVMTVGIELNIPSPQRIPLILQITPITAEGDGVDVDSQSRNVIFEAGSIREFVNISINDDNMVEPMESFSLLIRIPNNISNIGIFVGFAGVATGFITDDDVDCGSLDNPLNGQVELTSGRSVANYMCDRRYVLCGMDSRICQSNGSWSGSPPQCIRAVVRVDNSINYTTNENIGSVNITVLLDQPSCRIITITATPQIRSPPSARANDFDGTEVTVTINPGETSVMIPIGITDDNLLEDTEYFDVRIATSSNIGAVVRSPRVAEVGIISDDVVTVNFTQPEYVVNEDAGVMIVGIQLSREPLQRIAIQVVLAGNSAEGNGIDFNSNTINVDFQRRTVMQNVSIPIVNDDTVEIIENFSLSFRILNRFLNVGVRQGIPATAIVFIIDDDVDCGDPGQPANGSVNFTSTREDGVANYTCDEGFILIGVTQRICQANSSWSGDVPTCQIVDCGMPGIPANGTSDVTTTTFGSVVGHSCFDGFLLCGLGSRTCQANGMWSGSLPNCTMVTVTLDNTAYLVPEDDGFVEIELLLDQPSCVTINIVVQPRIRMFGDPENIASEDDFNINSTVAVFNPGETETVAIITIENDLVLEQNELFDVELIDSNITGVKVGMPRIAVVSIVNSNMLTVAFSQELYSVNESEGEVIIGLELSRPAGQSVTVGIRPIPNTAEGNNLDFDSMRSSVTFGPDDTLQLLNVSINNDAEVELEENFTLRIQLGRAAIRIGVRLSDPSETTVIIIDDDEVISVEFEQSSYRVNEMAENIEICLVSSGQNNADIFVRVQPQETVPASARASSDFGNNVSLVQFGPGEIISCYNQIIIDNTVPENFETFDVMILPNSVITIGNQSLSQITIIDDDVKANDTIIEDPVYTVPLQISPEMLADNPDMANLSLCYEIHGRADNFFNLVSDQCISITAEYRQSVNNSRFNFIGKIGVLAVDNDGDCQRITVNGDGCVATVGSTAVTRAAPYSRSGVRVRMNRRYYRIAVPNCELQDLVVWAICEEQNTLKFVITRGFNLQPTSHGLVAQFWNIPVELLSFTGQTPNNETGYYTVKVTPADGDVREFVGSLYPLTWDYTETPCLYAGNQQGGNAIEFEGFSDSVIEGLYWQYTVDSLFDTEFVFSQFNNSQCIP